MEFLPRPKPDVLDIDLLAEHIVTLYIVSAQTDHALGELHYSYGLPHIQDQDIATRTQGARLQYELSGLTNTHKVPRYLWMRNGHRTATANLLSEQRHYRAR